MKHLITGVAAIALAAAAAHGQGNSQGKGNDANRGKPAQAQSMSQGGGNQKGNADRGNQRQAERGNGKSMQVAMRANEGNRGQGNAKGNANAERNQNAQRNENRGANAGQGNRGNANPQGRAAADRGRDNAAAQAGRGNENRGVTVRTDNGDRGIRVLDDGRRIFETRGARGDFIFADAPRGLINGCPPGLAKRNNGCRPPGLARQDTRRRYANFGPDWWGLRGLGEGRYFYDDGYLLRLDGDNVAGYIPLLGGALALGNPWPSYYDPVPVPDYYVDYFDLGPSNGYRYADNVLYRVDPETTAITSIAALLTGNDIQIGAPMPAGYDMYNVPYSYRDRYRDGPDALYRYNDGYIYQLDPATQLVTAAIELIAS